MNRAYYSKRVCHFVQPFGVGSLAQPYGYRARLFTPKPVVAHSFFSLMTLKTALSIVYAGLQLNIAKEKAGLVHRENPHSWVYLACNCHLCREQDRREDCEMDARAEAYADEREQAAQDRYDWCAPEWEAKQD